MQQPGGHCMGAPSSLLDREGPIPRGPLSSGLVAPQTLPKKASQYR